MKDFKKLLIWQKGMDIVDRVYDMAIQLPAEERYGVRTQLTRSATAIPTNIAEGSAKSSEKDYARFLQIALGSSFELETLLLIVQQRKWIADEEIDEILGLVKEDQRMLQSFIKKMS